MPNIDNTDIPLTGDEALSSRWWNDEQDLLTNIEESISMYEHDYWQERHNIEQDLPIAYNQVMPHPLTAHQKTMFDLVQDVRAELKPGYTACVWMYNEICVTYYPSGPDSRIRYYVKNIQDWQALKTKLNY